MSSISQFPLMTDGLQTTVGNNGTQAAPAAPPAAPPAEDKQQPTMMAVFLSLVSGKSYSESYREVLRAVVRSVNRWQRREVPAAELTDEFFVCWLNREARHRAGQALATRRRAFVKIWFHAFRLGWAPVDPYVNCAWRRPRAQGRIYSSEIQTVEGELRHFLRTVYTVGRLSNRKPNTRRLYEVSCNNLRVYLKREALLSDLGAELLRGYLKWFKRRGRGRSPASVAKERANVVALWNYAARKRLVEEFPESPLPK
jgi:hypothetical protein